MSLKKNSLLFASGTFLSRITGLIRESVLAGVFGSSLMLDAFFVANRIPNLLRELLAEGALGSSFTQVYTALKSKENHKADKYLAEAFGFFGLIIFLICILGMYFAPELVSILTTQMPNSPERQVFLNNTIGLTRILFPFIGFMCMSAISSGVLHARGKFILTSMSPIALNCGYIIGALGLSQLAIQYLPEAFEKSLADRAISGLAFGVLVGGFLQMFVQLFGLRKGQLTKNVQRIIFSLKPSKEIVRTCKLMGPMILAGSAAQVNVLVNTNFATSLEEGVVSWLMFAFRLLQLPIGIFAVAIGTAALPALTQAIHKNLGPQTVGAKLQEALTLMLWLIGPCFCFTLVNFQAIIQLLYEHGQFNKLASHATATALYYYSFSLLGYGLIKVLLAFYYACEDTAYAMKVSIFSIFVNFISNYFLVHTYGFKGLAASTSITLSINAILLLMGLKTKPVKWNVKALIHSTFALSLAFVLAWILQNLAHQTFGGFSFLSENIKLKALSSLSVNAIILVSCFTLFWVLNQKRQKANSSSL